VIKGLSLHQPFASWVADGSKSVETRTWRTSWRGWILICSTRMPPTHPRYRGLPRGVALAVAKVAICRRMILADVAAARCPLYPGALAWDLCSVRPLPEPVPIAGHQRLWPVRAPSDALVEQLEAVGAGLVQELDLPRAGRWPGCSAPARRSSHRKEGRGPRSAAT